MSEQFIEVEYVQCDDGCGYIGNDFITDYNSSEARIALEKKGFNITTLLKLA